VRWPGSDLAVSFVPWVWTAPAMAGAGMSALGQKRTIPESPYEVGFVPEGDISGDLAVDDVSVLCAGGRIWIAPIITALFDPAEHTRLVVGCPPGVSEEFPLCHWGAWIVIYRKQPG
jgi:hypothetical protein